MPIPTWSVGQVLASADVNNWFVPLAAYKPAVQSVTSSTALVNDNDLVLPLAANALYLITAMIAYTGGTRAASDLKGAFTVPAGATLVYAVNDNSTGAAPSYNIGFYETAGTTWGAGTGTGLNFTAIITGTCLTSSTAGNLQFQWAQNTSSGTATQVLAGSVLSAQRIG